MRYKIYYSDGTVYDSTEGDGPETRGVQAIVQDHPSAGKEIVTGADYYIRSSEGRWIGVDLFGLWDWLVDRGEVLFGRMVTTEEYRDLFKRAKLEQEKSGWTPFERKPDL